ncbi:MAG: AtpZ/AtpI family protein [bacterium]|nr:AtpZ/AtpI family protein [bacterium]
MGKVLLRDKRNKIAKVDPTMDYFSYFNARSQLLASTLSMGWRLALTVLIPIFIGVQLDKKFDTEPSLTLATFFIAIFGAGMIIAKTYNEMTAQAALDEAINSKSKPKGKNPAK